jgi:hypothetical protein
VIKNFMMKQILLGFLILWILIVPSTLKGQHSGLDTLYKKFDAHRKANVQEKIYAHIDRKVHLTGEILWFSLYAVDGIIHKPLDLSKIAYVEILDQNNLSLLQAKIKMENGSGNGSLFLPASLNSGEYQFRAYTNWMKNFGADFFFHETITIINTFVAADLAKVSKSESPYSVEFFPEGGNLITGVSGKVGVKITDKSGRPINGKGKIFSVKADTLASFKTLHEGIGSFSFTPAAGSNYSIEFTDTKGSKSVHTLPAAQSAGYSMSVSESAENFVVKVSARIQTNVNSDHVYLFCHARQIIGFSQVRYLKDNEYVFIVPKKDIGEGIVHFTVFDGDMHPVCERLIFKYPSRKLQIDVHASSPVSATRRKVQLDITTKNSEKVAPADLSLSVYRADSLKSTQQSVFSYLWLTSDLKGSIDDPEYYFSGHENASKAMDNLMLTHGWRRFKWDAVLTKKAALIYPPEFRRHIVKGNVMTIDGIPAPNVITYLGSPDKIIRAYSSRSNYQGNVQFEVSEFAGLRQLVFQSAAKKDSALTLAIENPFIKEATSHQLPLFTLDESYSGALLERSVAMQVQDIYFQDRKEKFITTNIDSIAFYGKADETYFLDDYTRFPVMEEVMREYVPGVMVRKRKDGFHFINVSAEQKKQLSEDPLILLDGVRISTADEIMLLDPRKVRKLEVMTQNYYLGPVMVPGIVSYTTYKGDMAGFPINPKNLVIDYEGLQLEREFYSPQYPTKKERDSRLPDQRELLYWDAHVKTDENGKTSVEFYTSDLTGNFIVHIEGLTKDGYCGQALSSFSVKRFDN